MTNEAILLGEHFRLRFFHRDDRYAHVIALVRGANVFPLLESVEGSPEEDWPASPPLQSLDVQPGKEGQVALLVGMAGSSHWSVAVELVARGGAEELKFDVACRVKSPAEFLGSCYRTAEGVEFDAMSGEVRSPHGTCQLVVPADGANRTTWFNRDATFGLRPDEQGDGPRTRRWTYSLCSK